MKTHDQMINEWMQDPIFKKEYDALEQEFAVFDEQLKARNKDRVTQLEDAKIMGDRLPPVAFWESGVHSEKIFTIH